MTTQRLSIKPSQNLIALKISAFILGFATLAIFIYVFFRPEGLEGLEGLLFIFSGSSFAYSLIYYKKNHSKVGKIFALLMISSGLIFILTVLFYIGRWMFEGIEG